MEDRAAISSVLAMCSTSIRLGPCICTAWVTWLAQTSAFRKQECRHWWRSATQQAAGTLLEHRLEAGHSLTLPAETVGSAPSAEILQAHRLCPSNPVPPSQSGMRRPQRQCVHPVILETVALRPFLLSRRVRTRGWSQQAQCSPLRAVHAAWLRPPAGQCRLATQCSYRLPDSTGSALDAIAAQEANQSTAIIACGSLGELTSICRSRGRRQRASPGICDNQLFRAAIPASSPAT
eukprot:SAG31_NODE_480_length_15108_cov_56.073423_15_plen_235_part_00